MTHYRAERVGHEIQRYLSEMLQVELRDPRINLASITRVELSHDMRHAKVYVSAVTPQDRDLATEALQHARGFLRRGLAARISLRVTPDLQFIADPAVVGGDRVLGLLRDLESLPPQPDE
jgi:ribosome-binding factor A